MKESEFKLITEKLRKFNSYDGILKKNVFINWFFLLKPHPFFLKKYKNLNKNFIVLSFSILKNFLKLSIFFIINLFKKNLYKQDISDKDFDYVFISHHISNQKIFENDPYYRSFYLNLKEREKTFFIIYLNHNVKITDNFLKDKKNYYFFNQKTSFKNELKCYKKIFSLFLFYLKYQKFSLKEKFIILGEVLNLDTLNNVKIDFEIENLFNLINFKNLICTFEGYNFEKIIFSKSKNKNNKIKNIGYQHASITQNQNSIFEFQDTSFYPNKILTTGTYYKNLFEKNLSKKVDVQVVGSNKINLNIANNIQKENYCVVLPEAILSECEILFKFSLNYSKIFDNLKFIWRLHPLMNIDEILNKLSINKKNLDNIIVSSNTDHDFLISKYSLYRGSTAIFNSIKYSSYPIYLNYADTLNIDPIHDLKLTNKVNSIEEFNLMTNENFKSYNFKYLSDNVEKYFEEPNKNIVDIL